MATVQCTTSANTICQKSSIAELLTRRDTIEAMQQRRRGLLKNVGVRRPIVEETEEMEYETTEYQTPVSV